MTTQDTQSLIPDQTPEMSRAYEMLDKSVMPPAMVD